MTASRNSRIRVAFGIDNLNIGGTELNAVRLAERLDRTRFDLRLIAMQADGPLAARYRAAGVPIDVFTPGPLAGARAVREGFRLFRFLRQHRIEIFHAHDLYSNLFGCPWARLAGVKVIASRRWQGAPLPGRAWKIASRIPYRLAHVSLANSAIVGDMLRDFDRVPPARIAIVPNFVDEEAFSPLDPATESGLRTELGLRSNLLTVGIVANLRPVKDHATLLLAIARLRPRWDVQTILVGDGELRGDLQRLATELGIADRVMFAGRRPATPNLNHLFDVSVLCSRKEGLPNSVLEAMAAARPVVATRVGAVPDAVRHGETGLLVPPSEPAQLADALQRLLAEPGNRERMGSAGQQRARAVFSASAALAALQNLYLRLLPARRGAPALHSYCTHL